MTLGELWTRGGPYLVICVSVGAFTIGWFATRLLRWIVRVAIREMAGGAR